MSSTIGVDQFRGRPLDYGSLITHQEVMVKLGGPPAWSKIPNSIGSTQRALRQLSSNLKGHLPAGFRATVFSRRVIDPFLPHGRESFGWVGLNLIHEDCSLIIASIHAHNEQADNLVYYGTVDECPHLQEGLDAMFANYGLNPWLMALIPPILDGGFTYGPIGELLD